MIPALSSLRTAGLTVAQALERLGTEEFLPHTKRLFRIAFFGWLFLNTALLLPQEAQFWSEEAYVVQDFDPRWATHWIGRVINHPEVSPYYRLFIVGQLLSLALGLFGIQVRTMTLLALFFTINLKNRNHLIQDGGNNLSWLWLVYFVFVNSDGRTGPRRAGLLGYLDTALSNCAFFACQLQVIAVYATAGLCKAIGPYWQNGTAMYYTLQHPNFANHHVAPWLLRHWLLTVLATYGTLAFQLVYPVLVWVRSAKPYVLLVGFLLHLNIILMMGLPMFGLVMMVSYVAFFPDDWSRALERWFAPASTLLVVDRGPLGALARWCRQRGARRVTLVDAPDSAARADTVSDLHHGAGELIARTPGLRWLRPFVAVAGWFGGLALLDHGWRRFQSGSRRATNA